EVNHSFRNCFQRDRDRVVHSRPFRRLDGKTQVFLNGSGDHFRTRLTHTLEVSIIARTIARRLRLNEDLTEAIAMAHDLGHAPFGHTGERVLNGLLKEEGGFDHNLQSLRIVDYLEKKYPGFNGLNLTEAVRTGLLKHRDENTTLDQKPLPPFPHLEGQVADMADDLAYYTHDIDDGLEAFLLSEEKVCSLQLWQLASKQAEKEGAGQDRQLRQSYTVRCLIDMLVNDVIRASEENINAKDLENHDEACWLDTSLVSFSSEFQEISRELRDFLFRELYRHQEVMQLHNQLERVVEELYYYFLDHPESVGQGARLRIPESGMKRAVADYIAGMTDRFALEAHHHLCR
ncbi:MAG: dGTP triphosphohydrolase, partial [Verrucomicrobiota bacterium]